VRMSEKRKRALEDDYKSAHVRQFRRFSSSKRGGAKGLGWGGYPARGSSPVTLEDVELLEDLANDGEVPVDIVEAGGWQYGDEFVEAPPKKPPRVKRSNAFVSSSSVPVSGNGADAPLIRTFNERKVPPFGTEYVDRGVPDFVPSREFGRVELKDSKCYVSYTTYASLVTGVVVSGTAVGAGAVNIAQGSTKSTRVGSRLTLRSMSVKWLWQRDYFDEANAASTLRSSKDYVCRLVVVLDKQANAASPASWATVFDTSGGVPPVLQYPLSENARRFQILCDRSTTLRSDAEVYYTGSANRWFFSGCQEMAKFYFVPPGGITVSYTGSTGTYDTITSNGILFFAAITNVGSTWSTPYVNIHAQVRYTDM